MSIQRALAPNTVSRDEFVDSVSRMAIEVWDFHNRWGFGSGMFAGTNPSSVIEARRAILDEEVRELADAVSANDDHEVADESADVLFVAIGHIEAMGQNGLDAVDRVTEKNSRKTPSTHAIRQDTGKLLPKAGKAHKWE